MKRLPLLLLLFVGQLSGAESPLESLVNAERSFSKMSEERGRKAAFVEFFAEDSLIFRERWIPGRKFYMNQPESSGTLTWDPRIADISEAADFGYTTGPWEFRKDQNIAHGYYMSIWKKQKNGVWKVVLDQGINTTGPSTMTKDRAIWAPAAGLGSARNSGTAQMILDQERVFAQLVLKEGLDAAYKKMAAVDFLVFRDGHQPATGDVAFKLISQSVVPEQIKAQKAELSGSLACAYGEWSNKQRGGFVRLWKHLRDGSWKIVLDLTFPAR